MLWIAVESSVTGSLLLEMNMRRCFSVLMLAVFLAAPANSVGAAPLAERYLLEGDLTGGEKAIQERLKAVPQDDEARFGLGMVQFLQSWEHLGTTLYKYGARTDRLSFGGFAGGQWSAIPGAPDANPTPQRISHEAFREIIKTFVADINRAEGTLAEVKDANVKLPLAVGLIKVDLFGRKKPISAAMMLQSPEFGSLPPEQVAGFVIAFDRGDAVWLRGYCHLLAAWGEVLLAVDTKEWLQRCGHLIFRDVETPHDFLRDYGADEENIWGNGNWRFISDAISWLHLSLRLPMQEPERMKTALAHLQSTLACSQEMWTHFQAETDDDREWIPNPKQSGVVGVPVTQEMVDLWLETVEEAKLVLEGKKLIPFWRGKATRGVNLRRVFTEPSTFDLVLWVQGTAATPYLEEGELTRPETWRDINRAFGGQFLGFGLWFN